MQGKYIPLENHPEPHLETTCQVKNILDIIIW